MYPGYSLSHSLGLTFQKYNILNEWSICSGKILKFAGPKKFVFWFQEKTRIIFEVKSSVKIEDLYDFFIKKSFNPEALAVENTETLEKVIHPILQECGVEEIFFLIRNQGRVSLGKMWLDNSKICFEENHDKDYIFQPNELIMFIS